MAISIQVTSRRPWLCPLSRRELPPVFAAMAEALGIPDIDLDVLLVDDDAMAECNGGYLGCPGPTNVLAFPVPPGGIPGTAAGLILNLDALERESLLYGQDILTHTLRLLAHGMAHIAGHDHGPAMDEAGALAEAAALDASGGTKGSAPWDSPPEKKRP